VLRSLQSVSSRAASVVCVIGVWTADDDDHHHHHHHRHYYHNHHHFHYHPHHHHTRALALTPTLTHSPFRCPPSRCRLLRWHSEEPYKVQLNRLVKMLKSSRAYPNALKGGTPRGSFHGGSGSFHGRGSASVDVGPQLSPGMAVTTAAVPPASAPHRAERVFQFPSPGNVVDDGNSYTIPTTAPPPTPMPGAVGVGSITFPTTATTTTTTTTTTVKKPPTHGHRRDSSTDSIDGLDSSRSEKGASSDDALADDTTPRGDRRGGAALHPRSPLPPHWTTAAFREHILQRTRAKFDELDATGTGRVAMRAVREQMLDGSGFTEDEVRACGWWV
jgi:hypothetical protein